MTMTVTMTMTMMVTDDDENDDYDGDDDDDDWCPADAADCDVVLCGAGHCWAMSDYPVSDSSCVACYPTYVVLDVSMCVFLINESYHRLCMARCAL